MQTYLKILRPISTPEQYLCVSKLVEDFKSADGEGVRLQKMLQVRAETEQNWVSVTSQ